MGMGVGVGVGIDDMLVGYGVDRLIPAPTLAPAPLAAEKTGGDLLKAEDMALTRLVMSLVGCRERRERERDEGREREREEMLYVTPTSEIRNDHCAIGLYILTVR
jgi:hypothetical protein